MKVAGPDVTGNTVIMTKWMYNSAALDCSAFRVNNARELKKQN